MKVTECSVDNINYERTQKQKSSLPAPDGGWGWVVVFSSLLCNILVDGIAFSFGVLLPKFAEHFEQPKSKVSLAGSLMIGMYLCSGPIAGGLVNKYGCRKVTMIGSIISAAGVLGGSFSTTLEVLILSYGVIGGSGYAITLMYIVDRALLLRISGTKAAFLLSIIGIMNIFGRVLSGLMANIKNVNALLIHNIALLAVSIAVFLQPLCTIYPLLVVFAVIFGLCIAAHASLSSIILCDLLGVKRLATAFGLLGLARGISSVLGPLFADMGKVKKVGDSQQDRERKNVQAPDGGWGWVVVFSSLMCNILVDGIGLAYGVLLPKFAEYFQASKSKVSLVGSLMIGTYMCTGPIAGGLVNKYGCRVVTIIGSIISAFGVLVGSFSPSLDVLILCYGVIGGFGFGLMYLASIVSVGIYFDKKRPIATGIAVCGSGIGTFIFSPVLELLSEIFHWRGVLIIIAGIILNGTVCGMLIRPLQAKCSVDKNSTTGGEILISNSKFRGKVINAQNNNERVQDELYLEERQPFLVLQPPSNQESDILQSKRQTKSLNDISDHQLSISNSSTGRISKLNTDRNNLSVFHFQSLPALPFSRSNFRKRFKQRKCWGTCCNVMCRALNTLYEVFDFSLLLNASFVLLFIGTIFAAGAYYISFMYLVDSALLLGIPSTEAALLLSVIGIINIIGRILSGLVANLKNVNALLLNSIACLVAAIAVFLHPWCTIYPLLIVFCVVFGLAVAAYVCLTSIILCDLLGVERLANAFGLVGVARGIASVIAPFVAGMVFEATGNYDASFYLAGGMFFACAVFQFLIFLPCVKRQSDKHAPGEK